MSAGDPSASFNLLFVTEHAIEDTTIVFLQFRKRFKLIKSTNSREQDEKKLLVLEKTEVMLFFKMKKIQLLQWMKLKKY